MEDALSCLPGCLWGLSDGGGGGGEGAAGAAETALLPCTVVARAQLVTVLPAPSPVAHLVGAVGVSSLPRAAGPVELLGGGCP